MAKINDTQDLNEILLIIFSFVDDFLKNVLGVLHTAIEKAPKIGNRRPPQKQRNLRVSEFITLGIFRFYVGMSNWKDFYRYIKTHHKQDFPNLPSYENFVSGLNWIGPLAYVMSLGFAHFFRKQMAANDPYLADSSKLSVCNIKREFSHKTCRRIAKKSKSSMGWFYGFKLHIVSNQLMQILAVSISPGNVDDRKGLAQIWNYIFGIIVADGGYVGKEFSEHARTLGKQILAGVRANMKKLMTPPQHRLLKLRQRVESVFSVLKLRFHMESTLPRSEIGYFSHYSWCLVAYQLKQFFKTNLNLNQVLIA